MEKLTIEEKAKRYDEAIEIARKIKNGEPINVPNGTVIPDVIFPELREPEEVKIKKELIDYIKSFPEKIWMGHDKEDVIAWLEKNGEQKTIEEVNGEDYGIDALWHAQRILEKTLGSVDGYQSDDGILEHKAAITIVKKLYEQKPDEWSEEDERLFQIVIDILDRENHSGNISTTDLIACVRKLKSLRPQAV